MADLIASERASELLAALDAGATLPSIVARDPRFGWDEAYEVAAEILERRRARGERPIGRKIGFTNRNIWAQYRATAPIWAHVYDSTMLRAIGGRAELSLRSSARPLIEPEIALGLRGRPPPESIDPAAILEAVDWVAPSFEIVDCHFEDWKFGPADAAADFALHWRLVLGEPVVLGRAQRAEMAERLRDCRVALKRNGELVDRGCGENALGHPALALAHLASVLERQPAFEPLSAGEVVTTGTLTAAMPVRPGETWTTVYEGLPGVAGISLKLSA